MFRQPLFLYKTRGNVLCRSALCTIEKFINFIPLVAIATGEHQYCHKSVISTPDWYSKMKAVRV